jgi:DNA-binding IscR family transcriptional regulator
MQIVSCTKHGEQGLHITADMHRHSSFLTVLDSIAASKNLKEVNSFQYFCKQMIQLLELWDKLNEQFFPC